MEHSSIARNQWFSSFIFLNKISCSGWSPSDLGWKPTTLEEQNMGDQLDINTEVYPLAESSVGYYWYMLCGSPIYLISANIPLSSPWPKLPFVSNTDLVLLFFMCTVTEQLKKCWGEYVRGYCRKICRTTEIREVLCENGRYCCLNIVEVEARRKITKPPRPKPLTYALTFPQDNYENERNYTRHKEKSM